MGDIDLLVSRDDLAGIASVMRDLGYAEAFTTEHHVCTNRRTSSRHTVSASTSTTRSGSRCTRWWLSGSRSAWWISPRCFRSADERPGLNPYPSTAALLLHLLLHAAGNMRAHCLRQIQLHDIAALARVYETPTGAAVARRAGPHRETLVGVPAAGARLRATIPAPSRRKCSGSCAARARARCASRRTVRRSRMSHGRTCTFMRCRGSPGPGRRSTLFATCAAARCRAAARSRKCDSPCRFSRISIRCPGTASRTASASLRWLFSQPPRVQTMVSINAALRSLEHGEAG